MESITKNRQSTDTLRAMIARAYGPEQVPDGEDFATELGHGWFNVAYRVRLRGGREAVLKIAPPADVAVLTYEREMMRNELTALALIQEHTTVPVPHVDHADLTHELCDADWFAMPFIDADNFELVAPTLPADEAFRLNERLGGLNRTLNRIVGTHFGPLQGPGSASWRETFTGMLADVLGDGERAGVELGRDYDEVRAVIAAHEHLLDDVVEPRFVEWDLWAGNVMVRGGEIVSIIDHERAFFGDPLIEAGFVALQLPSFGDATPFVRGYGLGPLSASEERRRQLYTLYLILVMIVETVYRAHRDSGQYDWARERLTEVMALFGRTR